MHNISNEYWAGFFDGEGSVSISNVLRPIATLTQKRRLILDLAVDRFGGNVYGKSNKIFEGYQFVLRNADEIENFLNSIYPFLIIKKSEVEIIFDLLKTIKRKNKGCHPLEKEEYDRRLKLRRKLQILRPKILFVDRPSSKNILRNSIKNAQENKCFDCSIDLSGIIFGSIINKDNKLRCRNCSCKLFGPNKKPKKLVTEEQIEEAIKNSSNMDIAAKTLGLCRATLYQKRKKLGLVNSDCGRPRNNKDGGGS